MAARRGSRSEAGGEAAPSGAPIGPRRPGAENAARPERPSAGAARPSPSLVSKTKESTLDGPDLKLRYDDVGRGFLYEPILGDAFKVPDPCTGPRRTDKLTRRALRQIKGATIKAHRIGRPLHTFVTFTLRPDARVRCLAGELVLGKEMKRTLNALNEWLRRRKLPSLSYVWVAENVRDENPHVHLLTNYAVPRSEFDAFAAHLESLWGFGYAKIERVRKPERAGQYLMKALSYTLKGADDDQGTVIGNRYGISREILPKYETIDLYDCAEAAANLRALKAGMTEEIEEMGSGAWLTPHGISFKAGTDLTQIKAVVDELGSDVHMTDW